MAPELVNAVGYKGNADARIVVARCFKHSGRCSWKSAIYMVNLDLLILTRLDQPRPSRMPCFIFRATHMMILTQPDNILLISSKSGGNKTSD